MIDALPLAVAGMSSAASRAAAAGEAIATPNEARGDDAEAFPGQPRVGYLPLPADPATAFAALHEAEASFKANAAVLRTAAEMIEALYNAID